MENGRCRMGNVGWKMYDGKWMMGREVAQ